MSQPQTAEAPQPTSHSKLAEYTQKARNNAIQAILAMGIPEDQRPSEIELTVSLTAHGEISDWNDVQLHRMSFLVPLDYPEALDEVTKGYEAQRSGETVQRAAKKGGK